MEINESKIIKKSKAYVNELLVTLENHYYHQYGHSLEVAERAVYLWKKEWLCEEDLEMLALDGLFHDTWFVLQYENNEEIWAKIAKNFLKSILYPEDKIETIEKVILATKLDAQPTNIYEEIIKDSDLDNLWREDFFKKWNNLKQEIEAIKNIKILDIDWQHWYITLLKKHKFYTKTQQEERKEKKQDNQKALERVLKGLEENKEIKVCKYM